MTHVQPIGIATRTMDAATYDHLILGRAKCLSRTVQTLQQLEDNILPTLTGDARQAVEAYITAERELRTAELRVLSAEPADQLDCGSRHSA